MTYSDIPGWFDFPDLYDEAIARAKDGDVLVEVGCWLGKSSAYLHQRAKESGKDITLMFVDKWTGEGVEASHRQAIADFNGSFLPQWFKNMDACGADFFGTYPRIVVSPRSSLAAASLAIDASLAFVFIDAAHDYASVLADLAAWLPKLAPHGHIAGHDYGHPDVARAVNETLTARERGASWERIPLPQTESSNPES